MINPRSEDECDVCGSEFRQTVSGYWCRSDNELYEFWDACLDCGRSLPKVVGDATGYYKKLLEPKV